MFNLWHAAVFVYLKVAIKDMQEGILINFSLCFMTKYLLNYLRSHSYKLFSVLRADKQIINMVNITPPVSPCSQTIQLLIEQ